MAPSGLVAFLFTDIEGSTSQWERDPEAMRAALEVHDRLVRSIIESEGGYVFSTTGDGFCAAFDRISTAVGAAVEAQRRLADAEWPDATVLSVRMGIHAGEAYERDGDYFGPSVNVAARVMATAHGGQIVATADSVRTVNLGEVDVEPLGAHHLKGVGEPQAIVAVRAAGLRHEFPPLRSLTPPRPAIARPPPVALVEREAELAALTDAVRRAVDGVGSVVLLAGSAGAGKSSLVNRLVADVEGEAVVLEGACDPLSTARPLGPLREIGSDPAAGLGAIGTGDRPAIELFEQLLTRLRTPPGPVLVVIEDLHWADDGTLDLVRYLGRRVGRSRAVVVCTYRDDEVDETSPVGDALAHLSTLPAVERVAVGQLGREGVARLAEGSGLDPDVVLAATGGNAFFVSEVIATGDLLPRSVREVVRGRVRRLDEGTQRVVEAVAISPRSLDLGLVRRLTGVTDDEIDEAVTAGVLVMAGGALSFRHELAREAIESSLRPARRSSLHRGALESLVEAGSTDHARIAHHALGTGDGDLIIEHVPAAAREARTADAVSQAIEFLEAVIAHPGIPPETAAELKLELAENLRVIAADARAYLLADETVNYFTRSGSSTSLLARAKLTRGLINSSEGEPGRALGEIEEVIALLEPLGASRQLAEAYDHAAYLEVMARRRDGADHFLDLLELTAREVGDESGLRRARYMRIIHDLAFNDLDLAAEVAEDETADAARRGDNSVRSMMLHCIGTLSGERRRYDLGVAALEHVIPINAAREETNYLEYNTAWLGKIAFEQGRWDEAVELVEGVDPDGRMNTIMTAGVIGGVRVRRGDPGGEELLRSVIDGTRGFIQHRWPVLALLAEHLWLTNRTDEIPDLLADSFAEALEIDSEWIRGGLGTWMWRAGAIEHAPGFAEPYAREIAGDWAGAAAAWERIGCPYERGLALAGGDQEAMLEAVTILDELGATPAGSIVRQRLRQAGVQSVPRRRSESRIDNPWGLTGRQVEVLSLMVDGLPNGEIAEALFVSKKTIEHHVSAVMRKLGADTRARAIAIAIANDGLATPTV